MNERGHFFSEGNYDILGAPLTDGDDEIQLDVVAAVVQRKGGHASAALPRRNGRWALRPVDNPAFAAMIPQGFGAGVGRVGPYYEQGNWYRGGAVQMLFIAWLYGEQNQVRPMFPPNTSQEDLIRVSKAFDLAQQLPPVDWSKALTHLPETGHHQSGRRSARHFRRPRRGFHRRRDDQAARPTIRPGIAAAYGTTSKPINVPGFWFMSWYDVSIGPNLAAYNYVRKTARPEIAQRAVCRDRADAALFLQARHRKHRSWASATWATRASITTRLRTAGSIIF